MNKELIIVESPSKAEKIQNYLGKNYIVLASKGHITELAKGGKFGIGVDVDNNFKPKYVIMQDKYKFIDEAIKAAKQCSCIYLMTDPDREGFAIAWHIAQRLEGVNIPIKRATFNEITKKAILQAIKNAGEIDMNIVHSQEARRILDRLVGFMASPFLIQHYNTNLSAGRVQSVVTRMVIDREKEIQDFKPENYWTISVELEKDKNVFLTKYAERVTDQNTANDVRDTLLSEKEYVVSEVLAEEEKRYPSPPLITSTLQRICSKDYGVSADRTMKAAQNLYENGYCTYIRTDSVRIEDEALKDVRSWIKNNNFTVPTKAYTYKNKDAAQDAHECIRPTDLNFKSSNLTGDEATVYDVIWKYFIASQMMPAVYNTLKVTAHLKSDPKFKVKASGKALKSKGFLEILGIDDNSKIDIPMLNKGDICFLHGKKPVVSEKKQTQPPPRYSEHNLIKELEKNGIGRPSTYAELLNRIEGRNYVEKKNNIFYPTETGKKVTNTLIDNFNFMNYDFTSNMEAN